MAVSLLLEGVERGNGYQDLAISPIRSFLAISWGRFGSCASFRSSGVIDLLQKVAKPGISAAMWIFLRKSDRQLYKWHRHYFGLLSAFHGSYQQVTHSPSV